MYYYSPLFLKDLTFIIIIFIINIITFHELKNLKKPIEQLSLNNMIIHCIDPITIIINSFDYH